MLLPFILAHRIVDEVLVDIRFAFLVGKDVLEILGEIDCHDMPRARSLKINVWQSLLNAVHPDGWR